jgi:acyl-homoserine-lactone acylase
LSQKSSHPFPHCRRRTPGRRRAAGTLLVALLSLSAGCSSAVRQATAGSRPTDASTDLRTLASQVEIRRTEYGVPHIHAENLRAAAFALAYVQLEDHGMAVIRSIQSARGRMAMVDAGRLDGDFQNRRRHARAVATFDDLQADTRQVYAGFADGMNHFVRIHRDRLPAWVEPDFTPHDVLARDITWPAEPVMNRFRARLLDAPPVEDPDDSPYSRVGDGSDHRRIAVVEDDQNVGSNAFALAPSRTTSGHAILLRNPHLSWSAGYYEAHLRVPGVLDFYGDFRVGGPFTVIGGFNRDLGFATTNNQTRTHEFYEFRVHPTLADHLLLDGEAVPLTRELVTVEFRNGTGLSSETREFWDTPFGPVVHRADGRVYVHRQGLAGDFRAGEQWLEMMKASSLDEWKDAMRIGARATSNFTYADRAGNILYVWVSAAPVLPHPAGGDTVAIPVARTEEVWSHVAPFDSLPQLLNPPGGYVRNENDSPHFTNLNRVIDHRFPFWVEEPRFRFRSQHGHELVHNDRRFSLEDVVEAKHSMRMVLADRVKDDLLATLRSAGISADAARAAAMLEGWDNTVAAESRGGVLFEAWWNRYRAEVGSRRGDLHAVPWSVEEPTATPRGLGEPELAVAAFERAVAETSRRFGAWDVAWGEVHRVRRGDVDVPVGGCGGALGCYRVLSFREDADGRRAVDGGDGWVLAIEFGDEPRAYSVLAYGQSPDPDSPYHANQAAMFAENRMKRVHWSEAEIEAATDRRYRPGEERTGTTADEGAAR